MWNIGGVPLKTPIALLQHSLVSAKLCSRQDFSIVLLGNYMTVGNGLFCL